MLQSGKEIYREWFLDAPVGPNVLCEGVTFLSSVHCLSKWSQILNMKQFVLLMLFFQNKSVHTFSVNTEIFIGFYHFFPQKANNKDCINDNRVNNTQWSQRSDFWYINNHHRWVINNGSLYGWKETCNESWENKIYIDFRLFFIFYMFNTGIKLITVNQICSLLMLL